MKKYILLIIITIMPIIFSGCFKSASVEEQKESCLSQKKDFTSFNVTNYQTGESQVRVICR